MEHETSETFSTMIVDYDRFGRIAVSKGEQVFIYRRLQDAYDKNLVAIVNDRNDVIGYLDREFAASQVLPSLRKGVRFECTIAGEPEGDRVPLRIRPVAQSEVEMILSRQGFRRTRHDGISPLAGLFAADEEETEDLDEPDILGIDDEIVLFDEEEEIEEGDEEEE